MNITKYEIIEKIAETGSVTKTAEYFRYTQSSISQSIKNVEKDFGVNLFLRTNKGLVLTEDGQKILPYIKEINQGHRHLREYIGNFQNHLEGTIHLGSYTSVASHILPNCIREFTEKYPRIHFDLYQEADIALQEKLQENYLDLVIFSNPNKKDLEYHELWKDPFMIAVPEDSIWAKRENISLEELKEEYFIELEIGFSKYYKHMFSEAGFSPKVKFRMTEELSILAMVEAGHGIAILPKLTTLRNPYRIKMIPVLPEYYRNIGIATCKHANLTWTTKRFINFLNDYLQDISSE